MKNLFIGERSIQNDAVLKILNAEANLEFRQILPELLGNGNDEMFGDTRLIILDLLSFSDESSKNVKRNLQFNSSTCVVGISDDRLDSSVNSTKSKILALIIVFRWRQIPRN